MSNDIGVFLTPYVGESHEDRIVRERDSVRHRPSSKAFQQCNFGGGGWASEVSGVQASEDGTQARADRECHRQCSFAVAEHRRASPRGAGYQSADRHLERL